MSQPHAHAHYYDGKTTDRTLWLATGLTLTYAGVEAGVGWWAGSLALVADAGHMVNDAAALALAAVAAWLARRPASVDCTPLNRVRTQRRVTFMLEAVPG